MSLRRPYAATLQLLRKSLNRAQHAIAGDVTQAHISLLESSKATATIDTTASLAKALEVDATTFFAMVIAAEQQRTPREVLLSALSDLERLRLADTLLPAEPQKLAPPRVTAAKQKQRLVQDLKNQGMSRSQVETALGFPKTTVARLWEDDGQSDSEGAITG
ncbi:transcriptional regulator [Pseudomonas sp. S2_H01]|jgi:transcriptional regulator with XRE-family HTH domain